ncbi:MAG: hypothetical protein Q3Y17_21390, partial [Blautia sp.]|nr:hypothetical protein [Blautia sp.]
LVCSPHPASFRSHLTMDTLAFGYILPTTGRIPDLHRLETCAAGRTIQNAIASENGNGIYTACPESSAKSLYDPLTEQLFISSFS